MIAAGAAGHQLGRAQSKRHADEKLDRRDAPRDAASDAHGPPAASPGGEILMLVYPRFTALDLVGPQHVFSLLGPTYKTRLVWKSTDVVVSDTGVPVRPTQTLADATDAPAVVFVPGGTDGTLAVMEDPEVLDFLASRSAGARYVTSVCTGSLVLAAAGLLRGRRATTHWLALESLRAFGVEPVAERVVVDGNYVTGAGVTAGIDFALTLAKALTDETYAKGVQLMMEYDPQPPFRSGRPDSADPDTVAMLEAMVIGFNRDVAAVAGRQTAVQYRLHYGRHPCVGGGLRSEDHRHANPLLDHRCPVTAGRDRGLAGEAHGPKTQVIRAVARSDQAAATAAVT
ncbi:MAG: DJ-1/PfpI family protein [Planctomycetia bacterium]|nr:DJ-1/PfpI family protein [Planctomycetia bacterium]